MAGISTVEYSLKLENLEGLRCRPEGGLSAGAIAGIVIGCIIGFLILVCLILLIVLVIVRLFQHKPAIPSRHEVRTMAFTARSRIRDRFTMKHTNQDSNNVVYAQGAQNVGFSNPKDREAMKGVDASDPFRIASHQLQIGDSLADGRFAVVSRAYCTKTNAKEQVAAKALKNGFSQSDIALMASKIRFMKEVPPHRNLVKFIGFVEDSGGEGQIMVLELCDFPLKNWFDNKSSLSTDDLEQMLAFTLNIAEGVAHLHSIKKLHRRLAMRNVLLKRQGNGLVAKLIGFGPNAEDGKAEKSGGDASLPLKWLAPETLDTSKRSSPTYNEKTDAWSFGVTIWEIYSKGEAPYGSVRSQDIKEHLKQGNRLQCPSDCPPELFSTVIKPCWSQSPSGRPTFSHLVQSIQKFRGGSDGSDGAYYAANDDDDRRGDQYYASSELYSDGR